MNPMQKRRACRKVTLGDDRVGRVSIGGDAPVAIQSMCSVYTHDIDVCLAEIHKLADAGADRAWIGVATSTYDRGEGGDALILGDGSRFGECERD